MEYWFAPAVSRLLDNRDAWSKHETAVVLAKRLPNKPDPWVRSIYDLPFEPWGVDGLVRAVRSPRTILRHRGMRLRFLLDDVAWDHRALAADPDVEHPIVGAIFFLRAGEEVMPLRVTEFAKPVQVPPFFGTNSHGICLSWHAEEGMGGFDMGTL